MSLSGWRLPKIGSPGKRGAQSTTRVSTRTGWQFPISLCWSWPHFLVRAGSASTSASNPSCRKSSLGSLFCQSVVGRAPALWDFQRVIPKIQQIALSGLLRWSRDYPCLPPTVRSVGRERCRRFGEDNNAGLISRTSMIYRFPCLRQRLGSRAGGVCGTSAGFLTPA